MRSLLNEWWYCVVAGLRRRRPGRLASLTPSSDADFEEWEWHDGTLESGAEFVLLAKPVPRADRGHAAGLAAAVQASRARLCAGELLGAFNIAPRLGAVVLALLEDATPERRPALLCLAPAPHRRALERRAV